MIVKTLSTVCLLVGILLLFYPTLNDRYETYQQQRILKQWETNLKEMDQAVSETDSDADSIGSALTLPSPLEPEKGSLTPEPVSVNAEPTPSPSSLPVKQENVEGVLRIDKIDLKLPILTGATVANLKLSVASIENTGKAGEVGNYAIAGHRNLTYGKNFNRLDELEEGDWIEVDTGQKKYRYQVRDKQYVLPTDVGVLRGNGKDREITLITCHPMENPTHRLVVKGELVEKEKE